MSSQVIYVPNLFFLGYRGIYYEFKPDKSSTKWIILAASCKIGSHLLKEVQFDLNEMLDIKKSQTQTNLLS